MPLGPTIHRHPLDHDHAFVNAYLVETASGVVAIDSLLTVSDSRAMRLAVERLGKPLRAVLLTHSHPDHYGGLTELVAGDNVPIIAPQGVIDTIARDDATKEQILRPMFGDEWAATRTFPNTPIGDGESVTFDDATFTVIDLGPSESPHDSPWVLGPGEDIIFLGDQIYDRKHCYLADGYHEQWLANIETLRRRLPSDAALHVGHGGPVGADGWDWQRAYIETFIWAVHAADWSDPAGAHAAVVAEMTRFLPTDELQFLMELSIEPVAAQLGLAAPPDTPRTHLGLGRHEETTMLAEQPIDVMLLATDLSVAREFYAARIGLDVLIEDDDFLSSDAAATAASWSPRAPRAATRPRRR